MNQLQIKLPTDRWIDATWDDYLKAIAEPTLTKGKSYYYQNRLRLEMSPLGHDHAGDNTTIAVAINLFCIIRSIPLKGLINCSYRKPGLQEAQPDLSYYIGKKANVVPWNTTIVDLNKYPPPALVIEIANTSLLDDRGEKRLLYEELKIEEYWIVDVKKIQILAFAMQEAGSRRISQSQVLPGLAIPLLEEALQQTRNTDQSQVGAWLLAKFQEVK